MQEPEQNQPAPAEKSEKSETEDKDKEDRTGKGKIPVLQTFKDDISKYVKARDLSLPEIMAEASKQRRFDEETAQGWKFLFSTAGIILSVAGLAMAGWLIFFREKSGLEEGSSQPPKSLILAEKQEIITIKSERRTELVNSVQKAIESPINITTILDIPVYLETAEKKEFLGSQRFFEILQVFPPANFTQSLEGYFTLGVFYLEKNSPFLILKIKSFDLAFSGMLIWEKNIVQNLKEILLIQNAPATSRKFQDKIIKNRDVRILYDDSANPVLIYSFIDKQHLVIAGDLNTLEEIFRRFSIQ